VGGIPDSGQPLDVLRLMERCVGSMDHVEILRRINSSRRILLARTQEMAYCGVDPAFDCT
jgi:hypothetical protein